MRAGEIHIPMWKVHTILISYPDHVPPPLWPGYGASMFRMNSHTMCTLLFSLFPRWLAVDKGDGQTRVRINALPQHTGKPSSHLSPSSHLPLPSLTISSADDSTVDGRTKTLATSDPGQNNTNSSFVAREQGGTAWE